MPLIKSINDKLNSADAAAGFKTADVAEAFDTYAPFTQTVPWQGNNIPLAVAQVCDLDMGLLDAAQRSQHPRQQERLPGDRPGVRHSHWQAQLRAFSDTAARAGSTSISWSRRTASR